MKIALETTNLIPFLQRNKQNFKFFSVIGIFTALLLGAGLFYDAFQPIIRDFVVANVAHTKAGEKIPFLDNEEEGYTRGFKVDEKSIYTYGIKTNNIWAAEYTRLIIPYMLYEHATPNPIYPDSVGVLPFVGNQSFHVAGRMFPSENSVLLNERYFLDTRWNDQRRALATLVHELVHIQRGAFIDGESAEFESATSTATAEILAAMCNYGDELACKAFWHDIESLARTSLLLQLNEYGLLNVYETWAKLFWRDYAQQDAYNKSTRYWSNDMEGLMILRSKYNLVPWQNILAGVSKGQLLNTHHPVCSAEEFFCKVNGMPFEDTWYLLQGLMWIINE